MPIIHHNKLVRDKIPQIIEAQGKQCHTVVLEENAYLAALDTKLTEEVAEFHASHDPEELADILEVVYAAARAQGISPEALEAMRRAKAEKRGGFENRIFLQSVEE